jgi:hypothetical protein
MQIGGGRGAPVFFSPIRPGAGRNKRGKPFGFAAGKQAPEPPNAVIYKVSVSRIREKSRAIFVLGWGPILGAAALDGESRGAAKADGKCKGKPRPPGEKGGAGGNLGKPPLLVVVERKWKLENQAADGDAQ